MDLLKDGLPHPVSFELNIPFTDLLPLQAFDKFINKLCGELTLYFKVGHHAAVWAMVDPRNVREQKVFMENADVSTAIKDISVVYDRKFTQIGSSALIISATTAGTGDDTGKTIYSSSDCFLHCIGMKVLEIKSNMTGYEISDKAMTQIAAIIDESPLIYPSQQLQYYAFPSTPNENGLQTSVNPPLKNVVACVVAFPRRALDLTVSE
jgi:hypothetical protein